MALSDDIIAAVKVLLTTATAGDPPIKIEAAHAPKFKLKELTGKRVYLFETGGKVISTLTRAQDLYEQKIAVVVVDQYTDPAQGGEDELVPDAWIKERKTWVESLIHATLDNVGLRGNAALLGEFWTERCETTIECDRDALTEDKVFRSEVEVDFRGKVA